MPKRLPQFVLASFLFTLLLPIPSNADFCYTTMCQPGIPGSRIWWQCGDSGRLPYYSCCAGYGWDWADGVCYTDSGCKEGSHACYYSYEGIYRVDTYCCPR